MYQTTEVSTRYKNQGTNPRLQPLKTPQKKAPTTLTTFEKKTLNCKFPSFPKKKSPQSPQTPSFQKKKGKRFRTSKASFKDSSDKLATSIIAFSAACNAARLRFCASCRAARFSATVFRRAAQRWLRRCCTVVTRHCWAVAPLWTPSKALLKASSMLDKVASIERRFNIDDCWWCCCCWW